MLCHQLDCTLSTMYFTPLHPPPTTHTHTHTHTPHSTHTHTHTHTHSQTPLHLAARKGYELCLQILLENGAKMELRNTRQEKAIHLVRGKVNCERVFNHAIARFQIPKRTREQQQRVDGECVCVCMWGVGVCVCVCMWGVGVCVCVCVQVPQLCSV